MAVYWPGYALYDSVGQFEQALSGEYADWHPPITARLWSVLHALVGGGAGPMLALQLGLYWLGLGLIANGLAGTRRPRAAAVVLAIGVSPLFLGWQAAVLKDAQMAGALLAAVGLVVECRLGGRPLGRGRSAMVVVLIGYATLARANAMFATVPLVVLAIDRPGWRWRIVAGVAGIAAVLIVSPVINHQLLGAESSGVETTQPIYDLAGITHFGGRGVLPPAQERAVLAKDCYKPFFWDPLGEESRCDGDMQPLRGLPRRDLAVRWVSAILHHPLAYAEHRLAHLNSTERFVVPSGWPSAAPPQASQPNDLGLGSPGPVARAWQIAGDMVSRTPFGWPILYLALGLVAVVVARRHPEPAVRRLALALLGSALVLEASFGAISIASDLRYHLWPMLAVALACVLLADRMPPRRMLIAGSAAVALVLAVAVTARIALPPVPQGYRAMLA